MEVFLLIQCKAVEKKSSEFSNLYCDLIKWYERDGLYESLGEELLRILGFKTSISTKLKLLFHSQYLNPYLDIKICHQDEKEQIRISQKVY